jgi:hypothetical protein
MKLEAEVSELSFGFLQVVLLHNKDTFGRLREIASPGSFFLELQEVTLDPAEFPSCPGVVSIPRMRDVWDLILQATDEWEDGKAVGDHRKREGRLVLHLLYSRERRRCRFRLDTLEDILWSLKRLNSWKLLLVRFSC